MKIMDEFDLADLEYEARKIREFEKVEKEKRFFMGD